MADNTNALANLENPFIALWDDIKAEAVKVADELEGLAVEIGKEAVASIEDVFREGAPLAVAAVVAQIPKVLSGSEKFGEAVTSVAQDLQAKLGPVAMGDVQTLVQSTFTGLTKIANAI